MESGVSCPICQTHVGVDKDFRPSGVTLLQRFVCPECDTLFGVDITKVPVFKKMVSKCPNCNGKTVPCVVRPFSDSCRVSVQCISCDFKVEAANLTTLLHLMGVQGASHNPTHS